MILDPERIALILADAIVLGDGAAARKWCISKRTLQRYRASAKQDPALTALVASKNAEIQHDLATLRIAFLRDALTEMRRKLPDTSLCDIADACKVVGELHQVAMAVEDERPDSPDPEASEAEGSPAYGAH